MKIFVSHALKDKELITDIRSTLEPHGITLLIAEHYQDLNHTVTQKIENMIKNCDVALILLTKNGYNSKFVQQEIGYIKSCNKALLQVVEVGIEKKISGFTYGYGFLTHDPNQSSMTVDSIKKSLLQYWKKVEQQRIAQQQLLMAKQRQLNAIKLAKEKKENDAKVVFGILAGLLVLGIAGSN